MKRQKVKNGDGVAFYVHVDESGYRGNRRNGYMSM
jgi:hypothetical protein